MDQNDIIKSIVQSHNILTEIAVKGDDTIRMAQALSILRDLFSKLQSEQNNNSDNTNTTE